MKNKALIIPFLILFLASDCWAQRGVRRIFRQYKHAGTEHHHFTVPGLLFRVASWLGESKTERRLIRSIHSTKFLMLEGENVVPTEDVDQMLRRVEKSGIEPLIKIRDGSTRVVISGREKNGKIRNLFICVSEDDEFVLISMKMKLRISDLNKLLEMIQQKSKDKKVKILPIPLPEPPKVEQV